MQKAIELGIGFVTGRANVCNIVNNYYKEMIKQVKKLDRAINITLFILYDLGYRGTDRLEFYKIIPAVYKDINIKFITPEDIEEEKKRIIARTDLTYDDVNLLFGNGHARGRNTLMHFAYRDNMDYLLFWDDDEYPVANIKKDNSIEWKKQNNINMHIKNIEYADVTIGYHCGYISPIPYIDLKDKITEEEFKDFIEAISNDIISWESIKEKLVKDNGITYADENIASEKGIYEIKEYKGGKWVAGSTLCLNLNHIDKIPAFFNPPNARGEDTFFATKLSESKVLKVPVYHFHDGFLMYKEIMEEEYPTKLKKAEVDNEKNQIEKRFYNATIGWIRYKPLLMYITDKENYYENIKIIREKLEKSIPKINEIFNEYDFNILIDEFDKYSGNVLNDYNDYIKTNEVWNRLKK